MVMSRITGEGKGERGHSDFFAGDRNADILSRGRGRAAPLRGEHVQHALWSVGGEGVKSADDLLREIARSAWLDERPLGLSQLSPS